MAVHIILYFLGQLFFFLFMFLLGTLKPIKLLFQLWNNAIIQPNSPQRHAKKVKKVQEQILCWIRDGRKTKLCTGRPWWQGVNFHWKNVKKGMTGIHMTELNDIIEVDADKGVVRVEPLLTMGEISARLLELGWRIPVVPELNMLTVGGLICGAGLETSSHKYGLFCHTCTEFEIVLADGSVVKCSKEENPDLFISIPMSCGTLGFLTSATIKILPAKKFVQLEYIPKFSLDEITSEFTTQVHRAEGNEFVEGIMYGLDKGVIMVGNLVGENEISGQVTEINGWYKPGFNVHVKNILENSARVIEYIPLNDYYHRHDRNYFWIASAFAPFTENVVFRYLLGWLLPLNPLSIKLIVPAKAEFIQTILHRNAICGDYVIPIQHLKDLLLLSHQETKIYPIWLCGCLNQSWPGSLIAGMKSTNKMGVDVGIYGITGGHDWKKVLATMESFALKNNGFYGPYSDTLLTKEEFKKMFDHNLYDKVRQQLQCTEAFPEVYDKVPHAP